MLKTVAQPYAKAVFLSCLEHSSIDQALNVWQKRFKLLAFSINQLKTHNLSLLSNPLYAHQVIDLLIRILKNQDLFDLKTKNFLKVLGRYKRIQAIIYIKICFDQLCQKHFNQKKVVLETAFDLNQAQQKIVQNILKKYITCELKIQQKIEEQLLSGVRVRYDDYLINMNLSRMLSTMKRSFS